MVEFIVLSEVGIPKVEEGIQKINSLRSNSPKTEIDELILEAVLSVQWRQMAQKEDEIRGSKLTEQMYADLDIGNPFEKSARLFWVAVNGLEADLENPRDVGLVLKWLRTVNREGGSGVDIVRSSEEERENRKIFMDKIENWLLKP